MRNLIPACFSPACLRPVLAGLGSSTQLTDVFFGKTVSFFKELSLLLSSFLFCARLVPIQSGQVGKVQLVVVRFISFCVCLAHLFVCLFRFFGGSPVWTTGRPLTSRFSSAGLAAPGPDRFRQQVRTERVLTGQNECRSAGQNRLQTEGAACLGECGSSCCRG